MLRIITSNNNSNSDDDDDDDNNNNKIDKSKKAVLSLENRATKPNLLRFEVRGHSLQV